MLDEVQKLRPQTLRSCLRERTASQHTKLDTLMSTAFGWANREQYAAFLAVQLSARAPVERWLDESPGSALIPPRQCHLIASDLQALGGEGSPIATIQFQRPFSLPEARNAPREDHESLVLGIAWTLAGSALGNRSILKQMKRGLAARSSFSLACSFLENRAMLSFWSAIRHRIERPISERELALASQAAGAVFEHFIQTARDCQLAKIDPNVGAAQINRSNATSSGLRCPVGHS